MEPDAEVKVPGYFGAWAKRFRWKEYAIAWDAYFNDIAATPRDEQTAAARREAVETDRAAAGSYQAGDRAAERKRPAPPPILCAWLPSAAQGDRYELQGMPLNIPERSQALYGLPVRSIMRNRGENRQKLRIRVFSPAFSGRLIDSFAYDIRHCAIVFSEVQIR